jgi:hypothetical protein
MTFMMLLAVEPAGESTSGNRPAPTVFLASRIGYPTSCKGCEKGGLGLPSILCYIGNGMENEY